MLNTPHPQSRASPPPIDLYFVNARKLINICLVPIYNNKDIPAQLVIFLCILRQKFVIYICRTYLVKNVSCTLGFLGHPSVHISRRVNNSKYIEVYIALLFKESLFSDTCGIYTEDDLVMKHLQDFRIYQYHFILLYS